MSAKVASVASPSQSLRIYDLCKVYCERQKVCAGRVRTYGTLFRMAGRFEMFVRLTEPRRKTFLLSADTATPDDIESFRSYITNELSLQTEYPKVFTKILDAYPLSESREPSISLLIRNAMPISVSLHLVSVHIHPPDNTSPSVFVPDHLRLHGTILRFGQHRNVVDRLRK